MRRAIAAQFLRAIGLSFDDVFQEVHLKLWRVLTGGREIGNLPYYLHRVAATVTVDAIRRARARREEQISMPNDDGSDEENRQLIDTRVSPEDIAFRRHLFEVVRKIMGCFAPDRRYAVDLYLQGWNTQEISGLTGWSEPRARYLVYRGLRELRDQLRAKGYDHAAW